jgi:hypothetical protein
MGVLAGRGVLGPRLGEAGVLPGAYYAFRLQSARCGRQLIHFAFLKTTA